VDAFLLQLEGRKYVLYHYYSTIAIYDYIYYRYWRVYAPCSPDHEDALPLESSGNFTPEQMAGRRACFEGWLEQGDTLYLPRGYIHQASTSDSTLHSHHVTVSACRAGNFTFSHLLRTGLQQLLEQWETSELSLRRSLPPLLLDMGGVAEVDYAENGEEEGDGGTALEKKLWGPLGRVLKTAGVDVKKGLPAFVDSVAREFMKTALPPMLTEEEREHSWHGMVEGEG
jgi:Cupin superfamily protein